MADYECAPLWESGADAYNVGPESLPISEGLQARLWRWADAYDATLNRDDPASSGFPTEAEGQRFIQHGRTLQRQLQAELGDGFEVTYFDRY